MNAESKIDAVVAVANIATVAFSDELKEVLFVVDDLPAAEQWPAYASLAARLPEIQSAAGAGSVAVFIGAAVEGGMPAENTFAGVKRAFLRWCSALEIAPEDSGGEDTEPDAAIDDGLGNLGRSLVTHLKHAPSALEECRRDEGFVAELDRKRNLSVGILWVSELINKRSGELLVFHVPSRSGFRLSYQNLSNCFHLFTLLQAALAAELPDAEKVDENVLGAARGDYQIQVQDHAWWHYGAGDLPERGLDGTVWGEGSPDEIPVINGMQVILLWPPLLKHRSWDSGFFGPAIHAAPAAVELLSRLTPEEAGQWWETLQLDQPEDTGPKITCPACLSNNPETAPFCLHCDHPFPPGDETQARKPIKTATLKSLRWLVVSFSMFFCLMFGGIAAGTENSTSALVILCAVSAACAVVGVLAYKWMRETE